MTTKTELLKIAADRKAAATVALDSASKLVAIFGGSDPVAVNAMAQVERLNNEACEWTRIAYLHPKTRGVELARLAAL